MARQLTLRVYEFRNVLLCWSLNQSYGVGSEHYRSSLDFFMRLRRILPYLVILCIGLLLGRLLVGNPASSETTPFAPITANTNVTIPTAAETKQLAPVTANTDVTIPIAAVQSIDGLLEVHFIDVGQGDSIFIRAADGSTALIDGGNPNGLALAYLRSIGVAHLNAVILTHPHADHVGGLVDVLKTLQVDNVWTSGASNTTRIFERFIDTIAARGIPYHEAATSDKIAFGLAPYWWRMNKRHNQDKRAASNCVGLR